MKNRDIYDAALKILAASAEPCDSSDYEERAPYLIAAFCCETGDIDEAYRKANELDPPQKNDPVFLPLGDDFPCCDRFTHAAVLYLASMLIIDENAELSDKLFDKYCDSLSAIASSIPAVTESIIDRY